jgi:hypothetical protein
LILSYTARNLASPAIAEQARSLNKQVGMTMKSVIAAAIVIVIATLASAAAQAQGSGETLRPCTARVVYSEELPFAPIDSWLVKVTLEITPKNGTPYYTTLHDRMPWQGPPPRRGQAFRLWCDPANPSHLQLASGAVVKSAF